MTGQARRQTRKAIATHQTHAEPHPVGQTVNNRVWEAASEKAAPAPEARPLTVEFTALRLLEAVIKREGRTALCREAVNDCVHAARALLAETR